MAQLCVTVTGLPSYLAVAEDVDADPEGSKEGDLRLRGYA